jgi:hypothetical protein
MTVPMIEQNKLPDLWSKLFYRGTHRARRGLKKPAMSTPEKAPSPGTTRAA